MSQEPRPFKKYHNELTWATRIHVILTLALIGGAVLFDAWNTDWALTIIFAVTVVLGVESYALLFRNHPKAWRLLRWGLLLGLLALLLSGFAKVF